jgi:Gluconate 2-dehydrogenase subunit 3
MEVPKPSRRQFLTAVGNLASASWVMLNWPAIAQAAEHAGHGGAGDAHGLASALTAAEAVEVDAIAAQIVPGGITRDAAVITFIDNALGSFFAAQLPAFRAGLSEFSTAFAASGATGSFSSATAEQQNAFLQTVDETPFFLAVRRLTVLGLIALPKYGGNKDFLGWQMLGVENRHIWAPPFGFYDRDYTGFVPYPGTNPITA